MSSRASKPRDTFLLAVTLLGFGLWLVAIGPVRTWASHTGNSADWAIGVAPSFFAGMTFVLWQAFIIRSRALIAVVYAIVLIVLIEGAQLFLPGYTADLWDIAAGAIGAVLAAPVVGWRAKRAT